VVGADKRHTRRSNRHTGRRTTIRKHIECAPEASRGGRESMEMAEGDLT
jgi:hypothetical protein